MKLCSVEGCKSRRRAKGYCNKHYIRLRKKGDPLAGGEVTRWGDPLAWLIDAVENRERGGGCWEDWPFSVGGRGYPAVKYEGSQGIAGRTVLALDGRPLAKGQVCRHTCDNRLCLNPSHLLSGTRADNVRDAVDRGRQARGRMVGGVKLTEAQVREIRTIYANGGILQSALAARYGVSGGTVGEIVRRKIWAWLDKGD